MALVLSRKPGEAIQISGFNFVIKVGVVRMNKADVRLSIEADKSVNIMRTELLPTSNQDAPETHNNCRHCRHGGTFHDADCPVLIARSLINSAIRQLGHDVPQDGAGVSYRAALDDLQAAFSEKVAMSGTTGSTTQ